MEISPPNKRRAKHFSVEEKQVVLNMFKTFEERLGTSKDDNVATTAKAAGISKRSVYNLLKEYRTEHEFRGPKQYKRKRSILDNIDDITKNSIQIIAHSLIFKNEPPTVEKVLKAVNERDDLPNFKLTTMRTLLKELNFVPPLKADVPHKFECQPETALPMEKIYITEKRTGLELIEEAQVQILPNTRSTECQPTTSQNKRGSTPPREMDIISGIGKGSIPCVICQNTFLNQAELSRHIMIHAGKVWYKCMQCSKCFNTKGRFNKHIKCHRTWDEDKAQGSGVYLKIEIHKCETNSSEKSILENDIKKEQALTVFNEEEEAFNKQIKMQISENLISQDIKTECMIDSAEYKLEPTESYVNINDYMK